MLSLSLFLSLALSRVFRRQENPITHTPNYRRRLVSSLRTLSYLDDSPIGEAVRAIRRAEGEQSRQHFILGWHNNTHTHTRICMCTHVAEEVERRGAEAWTLGGKVAELAAKQAWRDEQRRALKRTTATFAVERAQRRVLRELSGEGRGG